MKTYYLLSLSFLLLLSCTQEEPTVINCSPTSVTIFNTSATDYLFSPNGDALKLSSIDAYIGTDQNAKYTYEYNAGLISQITSTDNTGAVLVYNATYSGSNLEKLTVYQDGSTTIPQIEMRYIYSGNTITAIESWYGNAAGTLFQIGHSAFSYDGNGDLITNESNLDIAALFTLAFGSDPTSYSPILFFTASYVTSNSPNPLAGSYSFAQPEYSIMKNLPSSVSITDFDGVVTTDDYTFESDANGYTTKATSGTKYLDATYECK